MRTVVERKPERYNDGSKEAKDDLEIMLLAFASLPDLANSQLLELHFHGENNVIINLLEYLRTALEPYKIFSSLVLGSMLSTQTMEHTGSNMTLLNQGLETSITYKKRLAEYLGIPTGKRLRLLLSAEQNILAAIKPWAHKIRNRKES